MILVAKCRLGYPCRYHGLPVQSPALVKKLQGKKHKLICPECEMGLGVPRPPIRKRGNKYICGDRDITSLIAAYNTSTIKKLYGVDFFVGTKGSPCCDPQTGAFALTLKEANIKTVLSL